MEKGNKKLGILRHIYSLTTELAIDSTTGSNQISSHVPKLPSISIDSASTAMSGTTSIGLH